MIAGEITKQEAGTATGSVSSYITSGLTIVFTTLVIVLLLIWLAPNFVKRVTNMGVAKSFVSLGIGVATPIVAILLSIILILTVVGISVFSSMLVGLIWIAMLATSITSLYVAGLITKLFKNSNRIMLIVFSLIASLVLWGLGFVPYVGGFLSVVFVLFGIGTTLVNIVYTKESTKKKEKSAEGNATTEETK